MCICWPEVKWTPICAPACRCATARSCMASSRGTLGDEAPNGRGDRRGGVHRLHALHRCLPGGRHRRRAGHGAPGGRVLVHRLRALPAALPGRLHRARAAAGRVDRPAQARRRRARAAPAAAPRAERSALAWGRGAQGDPGRAPRAQMNPAKRREIYRRFRAANPNPGTGLKYRTPYELLVAVGLSAQATDKSVNLATDVLYQKVDTPREMGKLGVAGLEDYIK